MYVPQYHYDDLLVNVCIHYTRTAIGVHVCISPNSYSQGIMLLYDVTQESSFDNIRSWIKNVEEVSVIMAQFEHILLTNSK